VPTDQDAWRQQAGNGPQHRATLVMRPHGRKRGEADRRQRRGHRHLDGVVGRETFGRQDEGHERHHQHAATDAQQAGQKTGAGAEQGQLKDQQGFGDHGQPGSISKRKRQRQGWRWGNKASASATGPAS
jgi:hypothetical protein